MIIATAPEQHPGSLFVLTQEDLAPFHPTATTNILGRVPGLHVDRSGGVGGVSSLYMRGGDPNWVAVYVDGIKVNDPTNTRGGSFDVASLDPETIERIEVLRGPASSVLGSDAISGAINIVTRRGNAASRPSISGAIGSSQFRSASLHHAGATTRVDYSLQGSWIDYGERAADGRAISRTAHANAGWQVTEEQSLRATLRFEDSGSVSFPEDSGGPTYAVHRNLDNRNSRDVALGLQYRGRLDDRITLSARYGMHRHDDEMTSPGVAPGLRDPFGIPAARGDSRFHRHDAAFAVQAELGTSTDLAAGLHLQRESGSSGGVLDFGAFELPTAFRQARESAAPFIEVKRALGRVTAQAGARLDLTRGFAPVTSPQLGIVHALTDDFALRASWGRGFKLPSFFALGHPLVGNSLLQPERSRSAEGGFTYKLHPKGILLFGSVFRMETRNAIDFEEGPPPRLVNRSRLTAEGIELAVSAHLSPFWSISGQTSFVSADIAHSDERLRNRPRSTGSIALVTRPAPRLTVTGNATYVGRSIDSSIPTGERRLDAYLRIDAAVGYEISSDVRTHIAAENIFDARYEELVGFPGPRRSVRLGVTLLL